MAKEKKGILKKNWKDVSNKPKGFFSELFKKQKQNKFKNAYYSSKSESLTAFLNEEIQKDKQNKSRRTTRVSRQRPHTDEFNNYLFGTFEDLNRMHKRCKQLDYENSFNNHIKEMNIQKEYERRREQREEEKRNSAEKNVSGAQFVKNLVSFVSIGAGLASSFSKANSKKTSSNLTSLKKSCTQQNDDSETLLYGRLNENLDSQSIDQFDSISNTTTKNLIDNSSVNLPDVPFKDPRRMTSSLASEKVKNLKSRNEESALSIKPSDSISNYSDIQGTSKISLPTVPKTNLSHKAVVTSRQSSASTRIRNLRSRNLNENYSERVQELRYKNITGKNFKPNDSTKLTHLKKRNNQDTDTIICCC